MSSTGDSYIGHLTHSQPAEKHGGRVMARILLKTLLFFTLCNVIYAATNPLETFARVSVYNTLVSGRERLPYGEQPALAYNLSLYNIPAMFASHTLTRPKAPDEFRVILLGDSNTWGWRLENRDTLAAYLNAFNLTASDGRRIVFYNLGYPVMSLTKDVLLLDEALRYQPDALIWLVTLESFPRDKQIFPPLVQNNPDRARTLIERFGLSLPPDDPRFVERDFFARTIVGDRRALADWLRLQTYGFSWAATGIDQYISPEFTPVMSDLNADEIWQTFDTPVTFAENDLAFDVLQAGFDLAGDIPLLLVNEPIFISDGQNADLRYNSWYPRWAYDQYRELLTAEADKNAWAYLDLWDFVPAAEFTDSPVHLSPAGIQVLAGQISDQLVQKLEQ